MLAIALLLSERTEPAARRLIGAAPLAAAMATARLELKRERSGAAQKPAEFSGQRVRVTRLAFPDDER
jgi:hypothetical protein